MGLKLKPYPKMKKIVSSLKRWWHRYDLLWRVSSVKLLEWETREMENIFALILFGFLVGLPSAPVSIMLELLPLMEDDLLIVMERLGTAHDPLGELFSLLDIG